MPSYLQYKKTLAVLDYDDSDIESWITVNGNHIPIKKGQTKEEAVKSFVEKKQGKSGSGEGSASHGKGDYTIAHKDKSGNTTVIAEVSHHTIGEKKTETAPKESESDLKKWDKEVTKYHDEEEKAEADFKKMRSSFGDHYDKLYNSQYLDDKYNYLVGEYEDKMKDPEFKKQVQKFVQARGDFISSDREIKAYMLALQDQEKAAQAPKAKNPDSPLVSAVAKALNTTPADAESEIEGAAQHIADLMASNDLRNGDVEETLRGLGVEPDYAEEFMQWAGSPKKKPRKPRTKRSKPDNMVYQDKKHPHVFYVDPKAWNSPANDPFYGLYN